MYKNMICAPTRIKHFNYSTVTTVVEVSLNQMQCSNPECNATKMQDIPFRSKYHHITKDLEEFIERLLGSASFTLKSISELTGVCKNIDKAIDMRRLKILYTVDGKKLRKPQDYCRFLGIDEFKLHDGHKYATHIINIEAARHLKKSKYVLCSDKATRDKKDENTENDVIKQKKSELFNLPEIKATDGWNDRFDVLMKENELLFKADIVKEKIAAAYRENDEWQMVKQVTDIIDLCTETGNKHFMWFARLLLNHFEGINNRIMTIRKMSHGLPNDEYFFLKIIDMSRRNPI